LTANSPEKARRTKCPTCGKPVVWSTKNPWRPFCSERCKLIDLGEWIEERHRIPDTGENPETDQGE